MYSGERERNAQIIKEQNARRKNEKMLKENLIKWRQVETCYYELIHAESENHEKDTKDVEKIGIEFDNSLESDFNTHLALSAFFQLVKETNRLAAAEKLTKELAQIIKKEFERMSIILGLSIPKMTEEKKTRNR